MYRDTKQELERLQQMLEEPQEEQQSDDQLLPEAYEEPELYELFDPYEEPEDLYEEEDYEPRPASAGRTLTVLAVGAVVVSVGALCVLLWWILRQRGLL